MSRGPRVLVSNPFCFYLTLVPTTSNTSDWISLSVILLICPFLTWKRKELNGLREKAQSRTNTHGSTTFSRRDFIRKLTFLSQICNGLLPILYNMERNPDWNVFLNMVLCVEIFFPQIYLSKSRTTPFLSRPVCCRTSEQCFVSLGASFLFVHARQMSCYGNFSSNNLASNFSSF